MRGVRPVATDPPDVMDEARIRSLFGAYADALEGADEARIRQLASLVLAAIEEPSAGTVAPTEDTPAGS